MYVNTEIVLKVYSETIFIEPIIAIVFINGLLRLLSRLRIIKKATQTKKAHSNGLIKNYQPLHHRHSRFLSHLIVFPHIRKSLPRSIEIKPVIYDVSIINDF